MFLRTFVTGLVSLVLVVGASAQRGADDPRLGRERGRDRLSRFVCGTRRPGAEQARAAAAVSMGNGEPVSFIQVPPILLPRYAGEVRFRQFLVLGDFEHVQFRRRDPDNADGVLETWSRIGTLTPGGRIVSVFEPSWPNDVFVRLLRRELRGFDAPGIYWGAYLVPGTDPAVERHVDLRLGSTAIPPAQVVRLSDTVQYASHVVNLVIPDFGSPEAMGGSGGFVTQTASRMFYEYFADVYDSLAFVPQAMHLADWGARHQNVRNDVAGIGLSLFDSPRDHGSGGRLRGVEIYLQEAMTQNAISTHEIAHQWGHYFDWARMTGLRRAGWQPDVHAPLFFPRETTIGAVLPGTRRVRHPGASAWLIEGTPAPVRQHPLELYAMGLIGPEEVPDIVVFDDQAQFDPAKAAPAPGTPVGGGTRRISINDILAAHGTRAGPVPSTWRRATVVVSREGLISQGEMNYWNFFAARLEDPRRSGVLSYEGHASFDASTDFRVDLQTRIVPRSGMPVEQAFEVDAPAFSRRDCPDVEFDAPLPSRYRPDAEVRVEGRVLAEGRPYDEISLLFRRTGESDSLRRFDERVSGAGSFRMRIRFRKGEEGLYHLDLVLFWPDSGAQYPCCRLSPIYVRR